MLKEDKESSIPWIHGYDWEQVSTSIAKALAAMGDEVEPLKKTAQQIRTEYEKIEDELDLICKKTCISCLEVCCMHATVWYDLRDLLYLYLVEGKLPERQMHRLNDGSCCMLTRTGCKVGRSRRPFICIWYICSSQKEFLSQYPSVSVGIKQIQDLRKQLENQYIQSSFSS